MPASQGYVALESDALKSSSVIFLAFLAVSLMLFVCRSEFQQMHLYRIALENNSNYIGEGRNIVRNFAMCLDYGLQIRG